MLNHLPVGLEHVRVSARLVTPSKRNLALADCRLERGAEAAGASAAEVLIEGQKLDMVVQSTLTELGDYVLRVVVYFTDPRGYGHLRAPQPPQLGGPHSPGLGGPGGQAGHGAPGGFTPSNLPGGGQMQAAQAAFSTPEPRRLAKYYRFKVSAPLDVATEARVVSGRAFVQVKVRNATSNAAPLVVSSLQLVPVDGYVSSCLTPDALAGRDAASGTGGGVVTHTSRGFCGLDDDDDDDYGGGGGGGGGGGDSCAALDRHLLLGPGDEAQRLFAVDALPDPDSRWPGSVAAAGQALGSVQVQWRTALAELGSHKSIPVLAPAARRRDVEACLVAPLPLVLGAGAVHVATVRVTNNTDRTMLLSLKWRLPASQQAASASGASLLGASSGGAGLGRASAGSDGGGGGLPGVIVHGLCSFRLGAVARGGGSAEVDVAFLCLRPGLHPVGGLVVCDDSSGREFPQPPLTTALVRAASDLPQALLALAPPVTAAAGTAAAGTAAPNAGTAAAAASSAMSPVSPAPVGGPAPEAMLSPEAFFSPEAPSDVSVSDFAGIPAPRPSDHGGGGGAAVDGGLLGLGSDLAAEVMAEEVAEEASRPRAFGGEDGEDERGGGLGRGFDGGAISKHPDPLGDDDANIDERDAYDGGDDDGEDGGGDVFLGRDSVGGAALDDVQAELAALRASLSNPSSGDGSAGDVGGQACAEAEAEAEQARLLENATAEAGDDEDPPPDARPSLMRQGTSGGVHSAAGGTDGADAVDSTAAGLFGGAPTDGGGAGGGAAITADSLFGDEPLTGFSGFPATEADGEADGNADRDVPGEVNGDLMRSVVLGAVDPPPADFDATGLFGDADGGGSEACGDGVGGGGSGRGEVETGVAGGDGGGEGGEEN